VNGVAADIIRVSAKLCFDIQLFYIVVSASARPYQGRQGKGFAREVATSAPLSTQGISSFPIGEAAVRLLLLEWAG
jgi:hypothetical protein